MKWVWARLTTLALVQPNTRNSAHFAHQVGHVDAGGARVGGTNPQAGVISDHLGENIQDRLQARCKHKDKQTRGSRMSASRTLDTVLS